MWGHVCFWDMVLLQRVLLLSWVYWRPCSRFGHWNWISPSGLLVGQIFLHLFMHFFGSSCPISSARKTYRPLSPGLLHSQQGRIWKLNMLPVQPGALNALCSNERNLVNFDYFRAAHMVVLSSQCGNSCWSHPPTDFQLVIPCAVCRTRHSGGDSLMRSWK